MIDFYPKNLCKEEFFNRLTHFPGVALGLFYMVLLWEKGIQESPTHLFAYTVFGLTYMCVFASSSIYHSQTCPNKKLFYKKLDHASIFIFMAGCYTPFVLINMDKDVNLQFLAIVWLAALLGVVYKIYSKFKNRIQSTTLYLIFGYFCFAAKDSLLDQMPAEAFMFLAYGGALYSIGAIFYMLRIIPYHHGIWHLFSLIGSSLHFMAIYLTY